MRIKTLLSFVITFSLSLAVTATEHIMSDDQKANLQAKADEVNQTCPYPDKPSIPNGRNSTREEMVQAQGRMKTFIEEGNKYIKCLKEVESRWGDEASDEERSVIVVLHNKAVDDMNSVADMFNSALRAFQGKN